MSPIPELLLRQIDRWCSQCVPQHARSEMRVETKRRGRSVTVVERRAPWDSESAQGWSERRVAQLRYGQDGRWELFSLDRSSKWRTVSDAPDASSPVPLLEEIDRDPHGLFWGSPSNGG